MKPKLFLFIVFLYFQLQESDPHIPFPALIIDYLMQSSQPSGIFQCS